MSIILQHDALDMKQIAIRMRRLPMFYALEQRVVWFHEAVGVYTPRPSQR